MKCIVVGALMIAGLFSSMPAEGRQSLKWMTSWAASAHGPYPSGNPSAQPDQRFSFPESQRGARDQTFRLIVRPDLWGRQTRIRLTNAFGTAPVTIADVHVGMQLSGAEVVPGTNRPVFFGGNRSVTIAPGRWIWSDAVDLPFVTDPDSASLSGRKLALSFHVVGESGPMTWHAKALTTSYVSRPDRGSVAAAEEESDFPFSTASWFFVDAVDMMAPADTRVIVAFGDSITDGTGSTMNGDDRWPDVLSRRLHRIANNRVSVVNAGIGGNQIVGPATYTPQRPVPGGPSSGQRLERDVLSLSGVSTVIWLEGINDLGRSGNAEVDSISAAMRDVVGRIRAAIPGVRVVGGTVVSALNSSNGAHGSPAQDGARRALNQFIRTSGLFDAVIDFDAATADPATGGLRPEFVPDSTTGGPGDRLHPNRAGYLAMGAAIDAAVLGLDLSPR
jgi:lysophospholipase L1-like esterase